MKHDSYQRNTERSLNRCCRGEAEIIAHSKCVSVVLDIQQTKRMLRIILSSEACPAVPYFSTLSHNGPDFREKKSIEP